MTTGRTVLLAVDGLDDGDVDRLAAAEPGTDDHVLRTVLDPERPALRVRAGGPSESAPALTSLVTGATVAHTGIATEQPFLPDALCPPSLLPGQGAAAAPTAWYAQALALPTLFDAARQAHLRTAALQWPATAGADIDLCLPLVEDLRRFSSRWDMAEATSSPRMVAEHLAPRRAAGVQLSQIPTDALIAEIAQELLGSSEDVDLLGIRLTGLGAARREHGMRSPEADRAAADTLEMMGQILAPLRIEQGDRVLVLPGRPMVPTRLLVHPNRELAARDLVRTDGTKLVSFDAIVWPDGPRGALHVRRDAGDAARHDALEAMEDLARHTSLQLRPLEDGAEATESTDAVAVLEGVPGTVFGLSATHRPLVEGSDPYYAGPRAVADPTASITVRAAGEGLPPMPSEGTWAQLGVSIAQALGLPLAGATAHRMQAAQSLAR